MQLFFIVEMSFLRILSEEPLFFNLQSEKRKQDLLSEIVLEEQRNRELSKIVKELLPEQNNSVRTEKPPQSRRVLLYLSHPIGELDVPCLLI